MCSVNVGSSASISRVISAEDVSSFAAITGDYNPIHFDNGYAARTRFGRRIVHGILVAGLISAVLGNQLPGPGCIYLEQTLRFLAPVYIGDVITATVRVTRIREDKPIVNLHTVGANQKQQVVLDGETVVLMTA